jgi:hypothetical protein
MSTSERLRRTTDPASLEIDEVTIGASLSTETSPPTEKIFRLFMKDQSVKPEV